MKKEDKGIEGALKEHLPQGRMVRGGETRQQFKQPKFERAESQKPRKCVHEAKHS